ncbi:hypothetical protein GCM10009609_08340 [Pseudonocardia aurantiaca]
MRKVAGSGLLGVVPERKEGSPLWVGTLLGGEHRGNLRDAHAVLGNRFRITDTRVPPTGSPDPLQHTQFVPECRDTNGVFIRHASRSA